MKSPRRALIESLEGRTLLANALLEFSLSGPTSITEGDTPGQFTAQYTVSLNGVSPLFSSVQVVVRNGTAVAGTDYTPPSNSTVIFGIGETEANVFVPIIGNTAIQANRKFTVTLENAIGAGISSTLGQVETTIVDDDSPVVTIKATDASATEGADTGNFRISRTGATDKALAVVLAVVGTATNGVDYTTIHTTVTIPAGKAFLDVPVTALADSTVEGTETVLVKLHGSKKYLVGSGRAATVNIIERESVPATAKIISAPKLTAAGGTAYRFTVQYTDNVKMDPASVGNNDVRVTGPNGYSQLASLVSKAVNSTGKIVKAVYSIPAAGGTWDSSDNGLYTISAVAKQVFDLAHNPLTAGGLGQFAVAVPAPSSAIAAIVFSTKPPIE
jgi:hypothetical protein